MADLSSHPDFDLDVALSADIDGELDDYAAELGVEPAALRAALDGPTAVSRRAELAAVRRTLGGEPGPTEALDDVTRRRLLTGAGVGPGRDRARPAPDRSWMLRAGAAAAITLVVVGALYTVTRNSGDSGAKSSGSSTSADRGASTTAAATGDLGNVGAINAAGIGRLLRGQAPAKAAASAPQARESSGGTSNAAGVPGGDLASGAVPPVAAVTLEACAKQYATEGTIRFRASGAYQGKPAVVLGIDTDRRTIVFVVAADDCSQVLYSASR